jgi:ParB-like chromosome segregation protein Spo0J
LKPSPHQARIHPHRQRRKLANLLQQYGQVRPLIAAPDGELIDGHAIWELLKESGHEMVDVVLVADQSPEALRALRLALNRSSPGQTVNTQKDPTNKFCDHRGKLTEL